MKGIAEYFEQAFDVYYSGASTEVFIGNTLVGECTMIGWRTMSTQGPAFAYNKEYFSTILHGKYHVEGQIAVNYVTTGYLEYLIEKSNLDHQMQLGASTFKNQERNVQLADDVDKYKYGVYKRNPQVAPTTDIKDAMRSYLWGHKNQAAPSLVDREGKPITIQQMARDRYFDILVAFGNMAGTDYGIRTILQAKIVGDAMEIANDGTAIQMVYSFVAQKADAPLNPKAPKVELPIGQKLPLHKVPEFVKLLGNTLVQNNIVEPVADNTLFLPVTTEDLDTNAEVPSNRFIANGSDLVPVLFSGTFNEDENASNDMVVQMANGGDVFGFSVLDGGEESKSLSNHYQLTLDNLSKTKRDSLHKSLISNVVNRFNPAISGTTVTPEIELDDIYGSYGEAPKYFFASGRGIKTTGSHSRKAVAELQWGIYKYFEQYDLTDAGQSIEESVEFFKEYLLVERFSKMTSTTYDSNTFEQNETEFKALLVSDFGFTVGDDFGTVELIDHEIVADGVYGKTANIFVWWFQYDRELGDISGTVGTGTFTALDDVMRYLNYNVNRGLTYTNPNGSNDPPLITVDAYDYEYDSDAFQTGVTYGLIDWRYDVGEVKKYFSIDRDKAKSQLKPMSDEQYHTFVLEVQWALNILMNGKTTADGEFDIGLEYMIEEFQKQYALTVDGIIGESGIKKLDQLLNFEKDYTFYRLAVTNPNSPQLGLIVVPPVTSFNAEIVDPMNKVDTSITLTKLPASDAKIEDYNPVSIPMIREGLIPDSYLFLFGQPIKDNDYEHFEFEVEYADDQTDISHTIGHSDFPLKPTGYMLVPRFRNDRRLGRFGINEKPFVQAVRSYVQALFDEAWADGLYFTGVQPKKNKAVSNTPTDLEQGITDITFEFESLDAFIKEYATEPVKIYDNLDSFKLRNVYSQDEPSDKVGNENELFILPMQSHKLSGPEESGPQQEIRQFVMGIQRIKASFSDTFDDPLDVGPVGAKWVSKMFMDANQTLTPFQGVSYISSTWISALYTGTSQTKDTDIIDPGKGIVFTFNQGSSFITKLLDGKVSYNDYDLSSIMLNDITISVKVEVKEVDDEDWPSNSWATIYEETVDVEGKDIYLEWDYGAVPTSFAPQLNVYLMNNPFGFDLDDDSDTYVWKQMVRDAMPDYGNHYDSGYSYDKDPDDDDKQVVRRIQTTYTLKLKDDNSDVIIYALPKSLANEKYKPHLGYCRLNPAVTVDDGDFKSMMLPLPFFNVTKEGITPGTTLQSEGDMLTIDDMYFGKILNPAEPAIRSASNKFYGTMYPTDSEHIKINQANRLITKFSQMSLAKAVGYGGEEDLTPFSEYTDSPYLFLERVRKSDERTKQINFALDPATSVFPAICIIDSSKDIDVELEQGIMVTYSLKSVNKDDKDILNTRYSAKQVAENIPAKKKSQPVGVYFTNDDDVDTETKGWMPTKTYITIDANKLAVLLDNRFNIVREAAMPLEDIIEQLHDGIIEAVNAPSTSSVAIEVEDDDDDIIKIAANYAL